MIQGPRELPILFKGPMVVAIDEERKTQTRRIVNLPRPPFSDSEWSEDWKEKAYFDPGCLFGGACLHVPHTFANGSDEAFDRVPSPKQVGDLLWVKETWAECPNRCGWPVYRADEHPDSHQCRECLETPAMWKPSIFMPRWASRLTLEILEVGAQRIQSISEEDAKAEGAKLNCWHHIPGTDEMEDRNHGEGLSNYRTGFANLWDSINAKPKPVYVKKKIVAYRSFPWSGESGTFEHRGKPHVVKANPWVWIYKFKKR